MTSWTHLNYFKYICTLKLLNYITTAECLFRFVLKNSKGLIFAVMSSFFLCCKTKTVIWQNRKNKRTIIYCILGKKTYSNIWTHTFLWDSFLVWTDVNNVMKKKLKYIMSLKSFYSKQLLFSLVIILSHTVRFMLNLINQY